VSLQTLEPSVASDLRLTPQAKTVLRHLKTRRPASGSGLSLLIPSWRIQRVGTCQRGCTTPPRPDRGSGGAATNITSLHAGCNTPAQGVGAALVLAGIIAAAIIVLW
jgi:hypothetical protein